MQILTQDNKESYELKENICFIAKSKIDMVHLFKMITRHSVFVINYDGNKDI